MVLSDIQTAVLQLLAECGWASKRVLDIMPYSYYHFTGKVKELQDNDYIRSRGKPRSRSFALNASGRNHLAAINPYRFTGEVFEANSQLTRHPDRAILRGECAAFLSIAGYSVHPHDKPALPAYTPPLPPEPGVEDWKALYHNGVPRVYPDTKDKRQYAGRLTPINCYYDAVFIKALLPKFTEMDNNAINYSRLCGALMTPSYLFRVLHSRDLAIKYYHTGEKNMRSHILSDAVFDGYLPPARDALLIFGDDFSAAKQMINIQMDIKKAKLHSHRRRHKESLPHNIARGSDESGKQIYKNIEQAPNTFLGTVNLGRPAFYLPLQPGALPLLRLMQYPNWEDTLYSMINKAFFKKKQFPKWQFTHEDRQVFILAAMNLSNTYIAVEAIGNKPDRPTTIAYFDWQHDFIQSLLQPYQAMANLILKRITDDFDVVAGNSMAEYWR